MSCMGLYYAMAFIDKDMITSIELYDNECMILR